MSGHVDLSNARIVEWHGANSCVAIRDWRKTDFWAGPVRYSEAVLSDKEGIRIVEEFPPLALNEIVGDAEAFWFYSHGNPNRRIASHKSGIWYVMNSDFAYESLRTLQDDLLVRLESVVPLYPRVAAEEVVS